jgi:hypothetical protein
MKMEAAFGTAGMLAALFLAIPVYAQFNPDVFGSNLSIGLSPLYPAPQSLVHLTLNAVGIDLSGSSITWRANGKIIAQGVGYDSADVTAGALGSEIDIEADVTAADGSQYSAQAIVAPTQLDLLVGSDSYTPPFYLGRALPSAGTDLIVQALAHFKRTSGALIPDSDITYTWKQDGEVLGSISGRGKSSAVIPILHLYGGNQITVDAISSDGTRSGETTVAVPLSTPILDLYEDHPLYGILYNQALSGSAQIPETEMTFAAVPYFAQARAVNDSNLSYAWSVNDTRISASAGTPQEITINADNSSGQAALSLEVTHATNYYLDATGNWNLTFSSGPTTLDPFQTGAQ